MTPFFSIIIPVYNVAPYLRECLDSVLAQTFTDWEAICVDDGSTDDSGTILDQYATKDNRFRVFHQQNAGVSAARNAALDMARGRWVLFLDGDDIWCPDLLATVRSLIAAHPSDKLFRFGFEQFADNTWRGGATDEVVQGAVVVDISQAIDMRDFRDYLFWSYAYERELFVGVRFPKYIRGEDRCVLNRIQLQRANAIVATERPLYGYRKRIGSAVNSEPSAQVLRDEMDHRLDIIEMIDASKKAVKYVNDIWLEQYFTRRFYWIIKSRTTDRAEVVADWRKRLRRLRKVKGLSKYGYWVAWSCSLINLRVWDTLVCYIIPHICEGGSPISWLKRKFTNGR